MRPGMHRGESCVGPGRKACGKAPAGALSDWNTRMACSNKHSGSATEDVSFDGGGGRREGVIG